jgi:hypothetical protein
MIFAKVSNETWFISKELRLETKPVSKLSETNRLDSVVSRSGETATFGVSVNQN